MKVRKFLTSFFVVILLAAVAYADQTPVLSRLADEKFDSSIPTIQNVLGYDFGEQITTHSNMEKYLQALSQSSQQIKIENIGETYEGRALYYVVISSAENMARLEQLRETNVRLANALQTSSQEAEQMIAGAPAFICLSYSVHGGEHSGVEAGLAMAYYLLASENPETKELLNNVVVIIDPMQNPDGRARFINHFYSTKGRLASADPYAAEHNETWPGGRYNHYLFDMNRDWTVLSQKETLARIKAYQRYYPQIFIDLHEMGENTTYFFPPPTVPQNPNLPASTFDWAQILGKAIAGHFDQHKIEYYTQETFDFWYPGYGDSWPTYNGAVTGTFEQGSVRGLVYRKYDGEVRHYQDAVWHHFLSSLATARLASSRRADLLRHYYEFRRSAVEEGSRGSVRQYIIDRSADPHLADRLVEKLLWQGIVVRQATSDFRAVAHGYYTDGAQTRGFRKGDYIIPLDQPLKRLLHALFEKETLPDKKFLEAEAKRREVNEPSEFYDISGWSLPLAYGLDMYWSADPAPESSTVLTSIPVAAPQVPQASYAYLLNYSSNGAIRAVLQLLKRDVRVYAAMKPFEANGLSYQAGSFIIKMKDNPGQLAEILAEVAKETGATFVSTSTGWTEQGPDIGSNDVIFIRKPRIAVVTHMPADPTSYGAIAYLLDQRFEFPFTPIQTYMIKDVNLNDYDVLIIPDSSGRWGNYADLLGSDGMSNVKQWIENGGTLIAFRGGAAFITDKAEWTGTKRIEKFVEATADPVFEKPDDKEQEPDPKAPKTESPDAISGSIARVALDPKHFLAFGYARQEIPVFVDSSNIFIHEEENSVVGKYADEANLKMSGLIWDLEKKRLAGKAYLTDESLGKGRVILFAEDPTFRAYWEGLTRLWMNGILFGPSLNYRYAR